MKGIYVWICVLVVGVMSQVPVLPAREMIIHYPSNTTRPIYIDFILDYQCPASKQAFPTLIQLTEKCHNCQIRFLGLPLPYHHQSFFAAQLVRLLYEHSGYDMAVYKATATALFNRQPHWGDIALENTTPRQVISGIFSEIAKSVSDIDDKAYEIGMGWGSEVNGRTRLEWKAATAGGAFGTPLFKVNGVYVDMAQDSSVQDWLSFLKDL